MKQLDWQLQHNFTVNTESCQSLYLHQNFWQGLKRLEQWRK